MNKRNTILIILSVLAYFLFMIIAEKYNHIRVAYELVPGSELQEDFYRFWSVFLWPVFSVVFGILNGLLINSN